MSSDNSDVDDELFWSLAQPLLDSGQAEEGVLMRQACLRVGGEFFAAPEYRSGDLIVKLPESRVEQLISAGTGLEFAPAGRVFREWVQVPARDADIWSGLLDEARSFVSGG